MIRKGSLGNTRREPHDNKRDKRSVEGKQQKHWLRGRLTYLYF
jgi:hypothetical protein